MKTSTTFIITLIIIFIAGITVFSPWKYQAKAENKKSNFLGGKWTGKFHSVRGNSGNLECNLERKGKEVTGNFHATLPTEDGSEHYRGKISGKIRGNLVSMKGTIKQGKKTAIFNLNGKYTDAMPYALQSCYGTFSGGSGKYSIEGVFIIWRFKK